MARIILVEDSDSIRDVVAEYLRLADHEVAEFSSGEEVVHAVKMQNPDLCILDLLLPGKGGFQIAKEIRAFSSVPLLFLTARDDEASRITGFEIGADDYIVKPFSPRELVLRVQAVLRRGAAPAQQTHHVSTLGADTIDLNSDRHEARLNNAELDLTNTEWRILEHFIAHPGNVVSREHLMETVLAYSSETNSRTIDSHVKNLRAKLGPPAWIETVRGLGYRFTGITNNR